MLLTYFCPELIRILYHFIRFLYIYIRFLYIFYIFSDIFFSMWEHILHDNSILSMLLWYYQFLAILRTSAIACVKQGKCIYKQNDNQKRYIPYIPVRLYPFHFYVYTFYNEKCRLLYVINDYISIIKIGRSVGKCMHRILH